MDKLHADVMRNAAEAALRYRETHGFGQRPPETFLDSLSRFQTTLPETGAPADAVIAHLVAKAEPGLRSMVGDTFFGWVIGGSHPVGVAADWLTSAWGQNAGNHVASPAAAAAEATAARWLLELLDLPRESSVGFVTGATLANFTALAAARGAVLRKVGWDVEAQGLFGAPPITVLIGDDAHTTVFSALQFLGLGHDRVVRIPTDASGRIETAAFATALAATDGPLIAILQAGQINTGAFDDFATLIPLAHQRGAWVHIDGAFGLWAQAAPERAHLTKGVALADSWATDGHKWLQTPYDCGYVIVRDQDAHRRAMTIAASYLPPTSEGERDPTHFVPELSRRARGFATWAMISHFGRNGIAAMVEQNCRAAALMAERLSAEAGVSVLNEVALNQFLVRFGTDFPADRADGLTASVIREVQTAGNVFVGGAKWRGMQVMRVSVCNWNTDERVAAWAAQCIASEWRRLRPD